MRTTILSLLAVTLATGLGGANRLHAEELDEDAQFALELLSCRAQPDPPPPLDNPMLPEEPAEDEEGEPASAGRAAEENAQQSTTPIQAHLADLVAKCIAWLLAAQQNAKG